MFSKPEKDGLIQTDWHHFIKDGGLRSEHLRKMIIESWLRSQLAGVSVNRTNAPILIDANHLDNYLFNNTLLLQSSLPILKQYLSLLDHHNLLLIISDATGVILHTIGDRQIHHRAEALHLIQGASWSEQHCGTNAIGTAIETGSAVQIYANEHYCSNIKHWTCTANVIRDPWSKNILGVLDISGLKETYNQQTLALVSSLTSQIEYQLYSQEIETQKILFEMFLSLKHINSHALILFNRHGQVVFANTVIKASLLKYSALNQNQINDLFNQLHIDHIEQFFLHNNLQVDVTTEVLFHDHIKLGQVCYCHFKSNPSLATQHIDFNADPNIIGQSPILITTLKKTQQLAKTSIPILLNGETGVGKELFAQYIHQHSAVHDQAFVVINCGSFSKDLISAELFGYIDGAFTGARKGGMKGKIEEADGGTLFLDEIGELPLSLQPHLLRAIEHGEIYRLGENKARKVNFRLISATNRDLQHEVSVKNFRLDLLHRVAVSQIDIPSLKQRKQDIALLVRHYLDYCIKKHQLAAMQITLGAIQAFENYSWPGNIRELRNCIEVMAVTNLSSIIDIDQIPDKILKSDQVQHGSIPIQQRANKGLDELEYELIKHTLLDHKGNITQTAKALGIAKSTAYLKIKKYHLEDLINEFRQV